MKDKWNLHFSFIFYLVLLPNYVLCYHFALPETSNISFDVVIMGVYFGSLAVGFTNGGLIHTISYC